MPWGWECRSKLIKQRPVVSSKRKGFVSAEAPLPGPQHYQTPDIIGGKGFSKIKRAPAYSFGHRTPISFHKPATAPQAPLVNIQGIGRTGQYNVTHGVVAPRINPLSDRTAVPGPGAHAPQSVHLSYKTPPAYTMQPAGRPPYEPWDQWTPSPNMYCPPIPAKKSPAFTLGSHLKESKPQLLPGPGAHNPNYSFVKRSKPAYSFDGPHRAMKEPKTPPPNAYCEKRFMVSKRSIPAPSFGIRHTPYLGKRPEYIRPPKLDTFSSEGVCF